MGFLNAVKNLFTEEVEVEEKKVEKKEKKPVIKEEKEDIQKEVIQVEIPSPIEQVEDKKEEKPKEEYKFPFFDDNDFDTVKIEEKKEEEVKEIYKPQKEEKKVFKPSPIISPVYGFLDKNYQKDEIIKKNNEYNPRKATVDEIRDRAYGSLESDIETTLFGNNRVLFDEENNEDVLKEEIKSPKAEEKEQFDSETIGEKPRHEKLKDDDDLTELLEAEMEKDNKDKEKNKKPRKISDKELFNLIDSMYEREMKEWLTLRNFFQ